MASTRKWLINPHGYGSKSDPSQITQNISITASSMPNPKGHRCNPSSQLTYLPSFKPSDYQPNETLTKLPVLKVSKSAFSSRLVVFHEVPSKRII